MGWQVDRLVSWLINSGLLLLLFILRDYKELSHVRLPLALGTGKAHRQGTFCFDLVSVSVDKGREEGRVVTLILQRGNRGDGG